ncbi:hypothetical protein HFP89_08200 [Wenzhouxiangella sp. XN79A]|uniref:hypothetical protein n=1 Tax=Wenzhouxiangella sp. XN79A TaxID=2724193 RepID=UPI00144A4E56|nr:hypothetical protein [Wenzhouxiangella sp. XN79A]NKI35146.1 hypothetical protein [Wenzhouxiangella sp. XN79A]
MKETTGYPENAEGLFSPAEYRVLAHYLDGSPRYVGLAEDLAEILPDARYRSVESAVALVALERIQQRLPRWLVRNSQGDIVETRKQRPVSKNRKVLLKPVYLGSDEGFGAGPGMSWRVEYFATWIPLFDRFVITQSDDDGNDELIGVLDSLDGSGRQSPHHLLDQWRAEMREDEEAIARLDRIDDVE